MPALRSPSPTTMWRTGWSLRWPEEMCSAGRLKRADRCSLVVRLSGSISQGGLRRSRHRLVVEPLYLGLPWTRSASCRTPVAALRVSNIVPSLRCQPCGELLDTRISSQLRLLRRIHPVQRARRGSNIVPLPPLEFRIRTRTRGRCRRTAAGTAHGRAGRPLRRGARTPPR
jgi:hypothetical protein